MIARCASGLAPAVATALLVVGCGGSKLGHETSRTRYHNFKVKNNTHATVVVYVGDDAHDLAEVGDKDDGFYWIIPGTYHVTLVGAAGVEDFGDLSFTTDSCVFVSYDAPPLADTSNDDDDDDDGN